jgi:hypothetical protein
MQKMQAISTLDKVAGYTKFESNISALEAQVSMLSTRITGDHYMTELLERAGEQLECKALGAPRVFFIEV